MTGDMLNKTRIAVVVLVILSVVWCVGWWEQIYSVSTYEVTGVVDTHDIVSSSDYVIWLDDGQELRVEGNFWHDIAKDDVWGQVENGKSYIFECWGCRLEIFELGVYWYPNVVSVKEAP
ncbi:MAG: hypothetical protein NWF01_07845 [Candidatus Bathyarchaeota archaeon]|nr:hypothetical protein [Candidatus Bathyarchaeota archaeon]